MTRNLFHRDFTLPRAGVLAVLIFMALVSGQSPATQNSIAQANGTNARLIPAVIQLFGVDCINEEKGVQL